MKADHHDRPVDQEADRDDRRVAIKSGPSCSARKCDVDERKAMKSIVTGRAWLNSVREQPQQ